MLNETFYLDGIDARSAGIQLQAPIEFSEAVPVVEAQTIPGRNGDLIWETGSYENRSGSASCFCLQKDVEKAISSAGRFLMGKKGYRRLETSDDPDHYWLARVENSPQIAMRLRTLAPFEIGFDCKPQRFLKSGENPIVFNNDLSAEILSNGIKLTIFNQYGFDALPLIKVYFFEDAPGDYLYFSNESGKKWEIFIENSNGHIYLDCDTQNAYNESGSMNTKIKCKEFPVFSLGETVITTEFADCVKKVEIIPRWWEL